MKLIDIILGLVILGLIGTLIFAVSTKVPEPFTELYFENHTTLPRYSSDSSFIFSIHNHENAERTYDVHVRLESNTTNATIEDFPITIPDGTKRMFRVNYSLPPDFGTGRVIVLLNGTWQSIHYWTTYAKRTGSYSGKTVSLDCLPALPWSGNIMLKLRGTYDPRVVILNNGRAIYNRTINGTWYVDVKAEPGTLDIQFPNDYYNATLGVDRNLYLTYLKSGGVYYEKLLVDRGSGNLAFDCENTNAGSGLGSNGAFRVLLVNSS